MAYDGIHCVCESKADAAFLNELFRVKKIDGITADENLASAGGVSNFRKILKGLKLSGQRDALKILVVIVADNDGSPAQRFKEVQEEIRQAGNFGVPTACRTIALPASNPDGRITPDVVVLMVPWDGVEGNLETLLFMAGKEKNPSLAGCVESFEACVKSASNPQWDAARLAKFRARSLLSASAETNPDIPHASAWLPRYGNPFPLDHQCFDQIADYIRTLADMRTSPSVSAS